MPTKTGWFIIVSALVMLIWEIYVIITGASDTISEQIWKMNDRTVLVAFCMGFIGGHFFWPRR